MRTSEAEHAVHQPVRCSHLLHKAVRLPKSDVFFTYLIICDADTISASNATWSRFRGSWCWDYCVKKLTLFYCMILCRVLWRRVSSQVKTALEVCVWNNDIYRRCATTANKTTYSSHSSSAVKWLIRDTSESAADQAFQSRTFYCRRTSVGAFSLLSMLHALRYHFQHRFACWGTRGNSWIQWTR